MCSCASCALQQCCSALTARLDDSDAAVRQAALAAVAAVAAAALPAGRRGRRPAAGDWVAKLGEELRQRAARCAEEEPDLQQGMLAAAEELAAAAV